MRVSAGPQNSNFRNQWLAFQYRRSLFFAELLEHCQRLGARQSLVINYDPEQVGGLHGKA